MHTNNPAYKDNLIVKLTFKFALDVVAFCEELDREHKYAISRQLIRSGTSVGPTYVKRKMLKVSPTLYINLKFLSKNYTKLNIGFYYVRNRPAIRRLQHYLKILCLSGKYSIKSFPLRSKAES